MTSITQCPECSTLFKVSDAQIAAHDGLVRCGRCHIVFNARDHLHDNEPSRQLNLPIDLESPITNRANVSSNVALTKDNLLVSTDANLMPIADVPGLENASNTLAQSVQFVEELTEVVNSKPSRIRRWVGILTALLLTLILLAQATYFFRVELAARLPGLKPLLTQYCTLLKCTIELPQNAELMVIESSELESDPNHGNIVTLHALLHNRADYAQAFPSLELTLTDLQDHVIARRIFHPVDYVQVTTGETQGIAASREIDINLHLDTSDLKPTGYRLFLFYPQ